MARLARVVVPGLPHHVTQRGNRRQPVFFRLDDFLTYKDLLQEQTRRWGLHVCLWVDLGKISCVSPVLK